MMNYTEAIAYVEEVTKTKKIVLGLDSMRELLGRMGNPQDSLSFIHIAGTNGKGSTLAFVASVCGTAGYRVGRYNSPSVFSYCEKIQINGEPIPETEAARILTDIRGICLSMEKDGFSHPTAFEIETAMSFQYFKEQGCDLVALETGMGGETDATNVVTTTVLSIIASVSMDHMQFLGNTLEEIARVKGGIIKPGRPAVLCGQSGTVTEVIADICRERHAPLTISRPGEARIIQSDMNGTVFDYGPYRRIRIPLPGNYQVINAVTALEAVTVLRKLGYEIEESALYRGMASVQWPGRFQRVLEKPLFVIDGAHNPDAARRLRDSINLYFTNKKILFIMGILADKDYREIVRITAPLADRIYTVTPASPRALDAGELKKCIDEQAERIGFKGETEVKDTLGEAVRDSLAWAGGDDVILAFGSLSYLGELSREIKENIHDR